MAFAQDSQWRPVTGAETLRQFVSGLVAERDLAGGEIARAEYKADGTGVLHEWGASFPRTWEVKDDDQFCITSERELACYIIEQHATDNDRYRIKVLKTGIYHEFRIIGSQAVVSEKPERRQNEGGVAAASAAEIAAELANPNTPMGTLNTNFDYISYDGDLPGASDESVFKVTFQPSLPYPVGGGTNFFVRPAIPLIFSQPVPNTDGGFASRDVELGDIGYDASLGFSFKADAGSNILLAGLSGTIPTATDKSVGLDQWLLGPEIGGAVVREWDVLLALISHQWDFAGEDSYDSSLTGGQLSYIFNVKNGWQILGTPTFSYNHKADSDDALTFPIALGLAKTAIINGRPWKMSAQYWNYIEAPDNFGPT